MTFSDGLKMRTTPLGSGNSKRGQDYTVTAENGISAASTRSAATPTICAGSGWTSTVQLRVQATW
jgi:hypothetical protein